MVEQLFQRAHEYANLANRAGPIATDLLLASTECGLSMKDLYQTAVESAQRKTGTAILTPMYTPSPTTRYVHRGIGSVVYAIALAFA